ncbi:MAG: hypothetical protein UW69_C0077G0015 [Microgenomates group bacterium GW2011_GWA2_44_7]|nr:MAG: hypothetical protein UW69_C0077G0015 [Microgenomates group bacterium GW2011_GWA2_44_7]
MSLMNSLEYRTDLAVVGIFKLLESATSFIILIFIFNQVKQIADWDRTEVLLVNLTFIISTSITSLFLMPGLKQFARELNDGVIDKYLVQPINLQFFASLAKWDCTHIFRLVGAGVAVVYLILTQLDGITLMAILEYNLMIFLSAIFFYSFVFILICSVFFLNRLYNIDYLAAILWDPGKWPTSIFRGMWGIVFMTIVPVGFAATVPVGVLTGRHGGIFVVAGVLLAGVFLIISNKVLAAGIRRYAGAGG